MSDHRHIAIDVDVHRAIEKARRSFSESENEILRRLLLPASTASKDTMHFLIRKNARRRSPLPGTVSRSRGLWSVELKGKRIPAVNMKDAYRLLLLELATLDPGFLDRFAAEGSSRRRFVATSSSGLYTASPHLAREHGRHLIDDWYFDTNLSTEQVAKRARIAARVAGLTYGRDVRLLDNLREV